MKALSSSPLTRPNLSRERIFTALLADPAHQWSVAELAKNVPDVSTEAARTTLYLLLAERLVLQSPGHRRLTFQLTADGTEVLRHLLGQWRAARARPAQRPE